MTGLTEEEYQAKFARAAQKLTGAGYEVFNPAAPEWNDPMHEAGLSYGDMLILDFRKLQECDAIYLLSNWQSSKGSTAERAFADAIGLEIMYE